MLKRSFPLEKDAGFHTHINYKLTNKFTCSRPCGRLRSNSAYWLHAQLPTMSSSLQSVATPCLPNSLHEIAPSSEWLTDVPAAKGDKMTLSSFIFPSGPEQ
jgi:hypothetical protein